MSFKLPANSQQFYKEALERYNILIDTDYWNRIDKHTLQRWLNNFSNDEELFFAIKILFHFQYRNKHAMISMFKQIIQVHLPQKLEELGVHTIHSIQEWEDSLKIENKHLFKLPFRFSTINKKGAIGESGDALFRLMAQQNIVNKSLGRAIDSIEYECSTVILVDDMTGTGSQFIDFYTTYKEHFDKFTHIIYCPLIAHEDALKKILTVSDKIHVLPAETLTHQDSFYNIHDSVNTNQEYIDFCNQIISKHNLKIKFPFGYSKQAILYGLDISTPNNNHSFIYHDKKWNPLLRR